MKTFIKFMLCVAGLYAHATQAQCPDVFTDINSNPYVCGTYGDANGVSDWNWEITDKNNANYCSMWYARTSSISTKLTTMGSPFVDATTSALDLISQNSDFKKEKGWELLRRDFGCSHVTAYPYFVLYNKYNGLVRVYVYQPETQPQYSGILLQIEPTTNPWPATTALGDQEAITPDKFLSANQAGNFGRMVVAVSEPSGSSRWSVAEFHPAFDPNIENSIYSGTGLKFTVFGVQTFDIKANIKGRSVSSTDPKVYNFNYVPTTTPTTPDGQNYTFGTVGEKFIKFGKSIGEIRTKINANATEIYNSLPNTSVLESSLQGKIKRTAYAVQQSTLTDEGFGQLLNLASSVSQKAGHVLKFINNVIGLFTGIDLNSKPAPMPSYTSYDLVLNGSITAKSVQQSFILRVPGTLQPNNDNGTYFKCPLGIVNLSNAPEADTVVYRRVKEVWWQHCCISTTRDMYVSYGIRNNLGVTFNDGAGLDLVSVQAAIVGEVRPDANGNASYNLLENNIVDNNPPTPYSKHVYYNYMRPDLESGRLEITGYDPVKGLHVFQTPYVNLECINGLAFNAVARTNVYLRVKAILKKKNDPEQTPILYIRDYKIHVFQGSLTEDQRLSYDRTGSAYILPPYANYTQTPEWISDKSIQNTTYTSPEEIKADNSITAGSSVIISASAQNVVYNAGGSVDLLPGFEALTGCSFAANINEFGWNIACTTPQVQAYQYTGNCYNTAITALRARKTKPAGEIDEGSISIYPTLSSGLVYVSGKNLLNSQITIVDASGRTVMSVSNNSSDNTFQLHLDHLRSGMYFIKIDSPGQSVVKKLILQK